MKVEGFVADQVVRCSSDEKNEGGLNVYIKPGISISVTSDPL